MVVLLMNLRNTEKGMDASSELTIIGRPGRVVTRINTGIVCAAIGQFYNETDHGNQLIVVINVRNKA